MKNLIKKILKEGQLSKYPQYNRGEIIVFAHRGEIDYEMAQKIAKKLGYKIIGEPYDYGYSVETKPGEEEQVGRDFVENYPEFFQGWEREDIRIPKINKITQEIIEDVDWLNDFFEYTDKRRFINTEEFNNHIDYIIQKLNNIKF
jgi:hypothetical protein